MNEVPRHVGTGVFGCIRVCVCEIEVKEKKLRQVENQFELDKPNNDDDPIIYFIFFLHSFVLPSDRLVN